jgi:hypothetical protein
VIDFVKDEDNNLGCMVITLRSIIEYEPLKLLRIYEGICFGHVMFKMCLYATNDDKVSTSFTLVNAKIYIYMDKKLKEKERKVGIGSYEK